ncbi:B3/B4 domain-containing protein (DNA/RNA-binding domain of Phe-tRNA-synthetase) [Anaerosphaera aminiphila DSM 21120]|uniref:B3/B4 domain-containing protein (DNA/RNA-binding domain of Phe-tRNA-synthetase) n=1 Tax=Anaerosphaera aminiphila DSM 21120 TaxID=1120995 RepID=A0A1M5QAT9_9FIRM|nr:phenylalanine--tRNA ligase beta subunit-related protein [Anaerosphaera aminiphila]SHH10859.1 B3/B4 domain-containing protein (DNA/RNA-binding domain of Phe-tRNA-synthetase) [Anaerosphaera aminiphila DSM 21120]
MEFIVDEKVKSVLGVDAIVGALLTNVDIDAELPQKFEDEIKDLTEYAMDVTPEMLEENPVLEGYREKIRQIGRSLKRYPPSAEALINNMKKRQSMPRINSLIDLYNIGSLKSMLSIGAHDADSFTGPIRFVFTEEADSFVPVGGGTKPVHVGDFVYRDDNAIAAYLDARDADGFKIKEDTKNVLLVIQGNKNTSAEMRMEVLEEICENIKEVCGGDYKIFEAKAGQKTEI